MLAWYLLCIWVQVERCDSVNDGMALFLMNCLSAVWLLEMFDVCLWRDSDGERARTPSCDTLLCLI